MLKVQRLYNYRCRDKCKRECRSWFNYFKICLGGLGDVNINPNNKTSLSPFHLNVYASEPVLSCLGSQYAGWSLSSKDFFL